MSTTGHESEAINVQGLKASLQKFKTDHVDVKADAATTISGYGITDAYTKSETYTKTEVNGLVDTPHQEYVTVDAYANLPASGSTDTIYRVANYDGSQSQVAADVYSEYAWDGTQYVFLCVKSSIGEVFDITVYNNNTKYADLTAALGTNGANVPESVRRGGMSVRFVTSYDNKYVRCNLLADSFTTDTTQWAIADEGVYVENPEFVYVKTDKDGKILWAIKTDGTIYYGAGVPQQVVDYINEKIVELSLDEYEDIVTFLGNLINGDKTLAELLSEINQAIATEVLRAQQAENDKVDKVEGKSLVDAEYSSSIHYSVNPEFVYVKTDAENRILWAIRTDGGIYYGAGVPQQVVDYINERIADLSLDEYEDIVAFLNGLEEGDKTLQTLLNEKVDKAEGKSLIDEKVSESLSAIEDSEERSEITTDSEDKIVSYRDSNGVLHENSGIMTPLVGEIKTDDIAKRSFILNRPREYDLPKYGNVKMEKELTYTDGSNNYNPSQITKVGSQYYVTSTLVDGQVVESSVEISIQENDIVLSQWPVNKDTKHYLKVSIDFNQYLSGVFYIEVKYQGHSTLNYPKKNFRFTFYKDILFSKKLKIKIGELIPASKFNLKAYWLDFTLIREHACYRIVQAIRETHSYEQQYPWNSSYPFNTQATGITNGFPINVEVSGEFRGIYWFCLAKDMNNFMLDDELMNGVCVQGDGGYSDTTFWQVLNPTEWSDLLADIDNNIGEDSLPYFQAFYDYLNGGNFNRETAHTHFDIKNWVDCFIILQMLGCTDLTNSNIILYAGEDKTIFSPMYYDMDWSFGINCSWDMSTFNNSQTSDQSLWRKIQSVFGEDIKQRYKELRGNIINMQFLTSLITSISRQIPYSDYEKELERWPNSPQYDASWKRRGTISEILNWIEKRIIFMNVFFNV